MFSWYPSMVYIVFASSIRRSKSGSLITAVPLVSVSLPLGGCNFKIGLFSVHIDFVLLIATENLFKKDLRINIQISVP